MCYSQGIGVKVPAASLFHEKKYAFFDLIVRGTSNILKILLGVPHKIWKDVVISPCAEEGICLRHEAAPAVERVGGIASVRFLRFFLGGGGGGGGAHLPGLMSYKSNESKEKFLK